MNHPWLQQIADHAVVDQLTGALAPGRRVAAEGAAGSAAHLLTGALARRAGRPILLLVAHLDEAEEAVEDLELFSGLSAAAFPALEVMPGETGLSVELLAERLGLVGRLLGEDPPDVLVAPVQALMQAVPESDALGRLILELWRGQEIDPHELVHWLDGAGYRRVDVIEEAGDFAVRGGIVDICPPGNLPAVRLDFFGDQIDEIAEIDLTTMGSGEKRKAIRLIGAGIEEVQNDQRTTGLWTMMPGTTLAVLSETLEIAEQARGYYERLTEPRGIYPPHAVQKALQQFPVVEINQFAAPTSADRRVRLPVGRLPHFEEDAGDAVRQLAEHATGSGETPAHRTVVLCKRSGERDRLKELITEHAPNAADAISVELGYLYRGFVWDAGEEASKDRLGPPSLTQKTRGGASDQVSRATPSPSEGEGGGEGEPPEEDEPRGQPPAPSSDSAHRPLLLVPHHELLHRFQTRRRIRRIGNERAIDTFLDIEPGDYVVHTHHGIAVFRGLRIMQRDDSDQGGEEYLTLEFAGRALLHVPATQIELVHKYIGGAAKPKLSKLGGTRWKKQKEQVAEAVRDLAAELLRVQAARQSMPGISYGEDTAWLRQFEAEFPYEETDDQLAAMAEIKKDMADRQPMDRLICGDVGYGKTELAMRAAFKAVEAGKQVAVLCPTTVLCEQHERTFRERTADYPVVIESINRFKGAAETRRVLEAAKKGAVDILIGTHRLLSGDVGLADLGLVIVDEEQRFGVEHKNKLMRYRLTMDVLTLSATPIPRTLHMSLLGLRDISNLSTPPADRRAVVTEVVPYEQQRLRHAVLRELNREGQVYFVHNRVHNIRQVAAEVQSLVPEARIAVGHGQMKGRELEEVMLRFVRREIDVLVCTTIIESGIDIPTANTMFISDADRFGLADLHQLRGRVGRYKHRAYCYLLLPKNRTLSDVASKRLRAIEQFNMLGAGFKIAMRDMEIRGVGNILGPQQSGHITAVGYELYCQLLEQATQDLKDQPDTQPIHTHLQLQVSGHLPRDYIPSDSRRIEAYRRINRAQDLETLRKVEQDLADAYGPLPTSAGVLIALAEIRIAAGHLRVESLKLDPPDLIFATHQPQTLSPLLERAKGSVRLVDQPTDHRPGSIYYRPPSNYIEDPHTRLAVLRKLLVQPDHQKDADRQTTAGSPR